MSTVWRKLAGALLKVVGRSPSTNVVSEERLSSGLQDVTAWNTDFCPHSDDVENQTRESLAQESPATLKDHHLHQTRVQQSPEGPLDARGSTASLLTLPTNKPTSSALEGNGFPVQRQHRRASSAGSEFSLSSAVSTTGITAGADTGFTQHGQYDLKHDVILRGEFISDQQAKVRLDLQTMCCFAISVMANQFLSCRQSLFVYVLLPTLGLQYWWLPLVTN